ncbi:MAG: hypothetical protein ACPLSM_02335 [Thermosphaera sp.]
MDIGASTGVYILRLSKPLIAVLVAVSCLRLIPWFVNNTAYSTDTWPLLKLAALLEAEPGVRILELATHHAKYRFPS